MQQERAEPCGSQYPVLFACCSNCAWCSSTGATRWMQDWACIDQADTQPRLLPLG